jgi:hypothetical protein
LFHTTPEDAGRVVGRLSAHVVKREARVEVPSAPADVFVTMPAVLRAVSVSDEKLPAAGVVSPIAGGVAKLAVANVPRPKFVLAVEAFDRSERLLVLTSALASVAAALDADVAAEVALLDALEALEAALVSLVDAADADAAALVALKAAALCEAAAVAS